MAVALQAPLICVIQNNQVALGTRVGDGLVGNFSAYGDAYGAKLIEMSGNHILDVYAAAVEAVKVCREGHGPVIMLGRTFRMGGHATHDEREARRVAVARVGLEGEGAARTEGAVDRVAPGLVDSPPISIHSAPSSDIEMADSVASSTELYRESL